MKFQICNFLSILVIDGEGTSFEIVLRSMSLHLTHDKSVFAISQEAIT